MFGLFIYIMLTGSQMRFCRAVKAEHVGGW